MAAIDSEAEKTSQQESNLNEIPTNTALITPENTVNDVKMETEETSTEKKSLLSSSEDQNNKGAKVYTEAEKLKRKEFFKQLKEKRSLKFQMRKSSLLKNPQSRINKTNVISYTMTDEDAKMLDFYKVRLSTLRKENQELHKRLAHVVHENMSYLQRGPPTQLRKTVKKGFNT